MEILIITGPPYSGKGTQCEMLKNELGYEHVSTGDRIRKEKAERTPFGLMASAYEEKGQLVPDAEMNKLLAQIIEENKNKVGIILDGYPRTAAQVDTLLEFLQTLRLPVKKVLNIEVPKEELLARALKRAEISDRKDDQDTATHYKRIQVFEASTRPAIAYMKTKLSVTDIDGLGPIEEITTKIKAAIGY